MGELTARSPVAFVVMTFLLPGGGSRELALVLITNQEIWAHLGNEGPVTIHTCVITEDCQSSVIPAGKRAILHFFSS